MGEDEGSGPGQVPVPHRPHPPGAVGEFAVLESLDNGKPIREARDVDIPLAAAHFFYYAGWADKLEHAGVGASPRPLGVAGQVIPWNFPLLMAAWKLAPALAAGNCCVLKPAETTPLTALLLAEVCQQVDLPPGVVNIVTGAAATGAALVAHPGLDKVAFTGSTEVGKEILSTLAGTGRRLTLELGGKAANIVFDDAPLDQTIEGIVTGIFFNQGQVCCAGSRLLVQESVADVVIERLKQRLTTLRLGDPLDKNTDIGAINSSAQLAKIRQLSDSGESEGAERWSPACELPDRGYWFPPTVFTGVSQSHRIPREEIFGPVLSVLTFRTRPKRWSRPTTRPTGCPPACGPRRGAASSGWPNGWRRASCGPTPSTASTRPAPSVATRSPGSAGKAAATAWRPTSMPESAGHLDVRKTYKLFIKGAFPRSESGRSYDVMAADGRWLANAAWASRKDARDAVVAAREAVGGWSAATAYNRGQVLYRVAEMLEGRVAQFAAEVAAAEGLPAGRARRAVEATVDRWVWYAGWADKFAQVTGSANPVAGPYFNFSLPEPTGVVAVVAPQDSSFLGLVSVLAPVIVTGNTAVVVASEARPLPAANLTEVLATSDIPAGVVNLLTGRTAELAPVLAAHMDVNAIDLSGAAAEQLADLERAAAGNVKRVLVRTDAWDREPSLARMKAFIEIKTVWHPLGV